jgi:hypothetical protein
VEDFMTRKLITLALLGATTVPALLAAGCASGDANQPYSLTGQSQVQTDQAHQEWLRKQQYTDQKGRYHAELDPANRGNQ